jgi:hypothetical protein
MDINIHFSFLCLFVCVILNCNLWLQCDWLSNLFDFFMTTFVVIYPFVSNMVASQGAHLDSSPHNTVV